jgi:AraC-like DNA-binding protein
LPEIIMNRGVTFPPVGACVLQRVLLVDCYERPAGHVIDAASLPGHLIQLTLTGETEHDANGRRYRFKPGSFIWFHENEHVRGRVIAGPWKFLTLNFIAPGLGPPSFEARMKQVGMSHRRAFEQILERWRDVSQLPAVREMRVQAALLELLASVWGTPGQMFQMDPSSQLWWEIETAFRADMSRPMSLSIMARQTGRSQATIARSCMAAVGCPPMKRIKAIRMSMAHGLVIRSSLLIKEIAARVGYDRLHEFSRDYRKAMGLSPRQHRLTR